MSLPPGTPLGPYRIVAPLGAGGMGEVYRARDERLGRDVAIKVLLPEVASDPDRVARFEREAQVLAALSHPNILAIHDFGKEKLSLRGAGGPEAVPPQEITYAVTELLEGETLRERLRQERLPWRKAVEIAAAIADGLAAAHGKGIIHRDLKPDNVFVTSDGRVKILDFGLARLAVSPLAEAQTLTSPPPGTLAGAVLGTVGYMAPEQVRGEAADARSDIFALGCVLYEMLTGARAFKRDTAAETMTAILREPAPEVSVSGVEAIPEVNRVLWRCLEKQPAQRFQSAADLAFGLRSLVTDRAAAAMAAAAATAGIAGPPSIVVLPFENLSPDPDNAYFADGLTEELIADVSKVRALRVISRTSAMHFKGTTKQLPEVARELNVRYVLEGSVRRAGNSLRITAQLIDAATDVHLWAEKYAGTLEDVFNLQEQLSRRIVEALVELTAGDRERLRRRPTSDPEAYRLYLQGRYCWNRRSEEGLRQAIDLYEQAVRRDPAFALAHAGIADAYVSLEWLDLMPREEAFARASAAATRAVESDPDSADAHVVLATLKGMHLWDWQGAEQEFRTALALDASHAEGHHQYAHLLSAEGHHAEALAHMRRAAEVEPAVAAIASCLGRVLFLARRYDEAIEQLEASMTLDPRYKEFNLWLGMARLQMGQPALAIADFESAAQQPQYSPQAVAALAVAYARLGEREQAHAQLARLQSMEAERSVDPVFFAWVHVGLGNVDAAVGALERAVSVRSNWSLHLKVDPLLDPLRGYPAFEELIRPKG